MRYLAAFDKFKDSMSADEACAAATEVLGRDTLSAPLTDGGEGFARILTEAAGGSLHHAEVPGPRFTLQQAEWGMVELGRLPPFARQLLELPAAGSLAIIEMAQAAGLQSLPAEDRDPHRTSTHGVGALIAAAIEEGAEAILVGIGGSATSDLGLGALQALGLRTLDDTGQPLERITPALWPRLAGFAGSFAAVARGKGGFPQIRVACDVSNPLHGKDGAAAVYGPQKGLKKEEVGDFDARAATVSRGLLEFFGQPLSLRDEPGAGAAGGLGFGLRAAFGAELVPGFELVSAWIGLEEKISAVDCVLTGEGKFDVSSLAGKGPFAVIQAAHQLDKGVCVFAGVVTPEARSRLEEDFGARAVSIEHPEEDLETNLQEGRRNLTEALKRFKGTEPGG